MIKGFIFFNCVIFLALCLSSCETVMTPSEVNRQYSTVNIQEFIKDRYVTHTLSNSMHDNGGRYAGQYTARLLSDGVSVIYAAYFTPDNSKLLYKPARELQSFCEAKKGKFYIVKRYDDNFLGLKENPTDEYFNRLNTNLLSIINIVKINTVIFGPVSTTVASSTQMILLSSDFQNEPVNSSGVSQVYQAAIANNAFGLYKCVDQSNQVLWGVNVKPVGYMPARNSGEVMSHVSGLYLLITPISRDKKLG